MSLFEYLENGTEDKKQLYYGVCPAVVTNINDPEKLGRVKVKLLNLDIPDYETDFIRVCTPMSGAQWGMMFFPNVGDEVLVSFAGGDLTRGYVIGSLWNKNFKTPAEIKEENPVRIIKTKCGHKLVFDDTDGKEHIDIETKGGLTVTLNDEKNCVTITDKNKKNIIKLDAQNGAVTIQAEKKATISAGSTKIVLEDSGSLSMRSDSSAKLKSAKITVDGDSTEVKAGGTLNLSSNGQTAVKGSIVKIN
ncbi:MAG: phage baseplate assembly protein V [Ruminiclostridium sp.]